MSNQPDPSNSQPVWTQSVGRAAQYLTTLTLQSSAEASLLTREHKLVASAGQFDPAGIDELAQIVTTNWSNDHEVSAQVRFIRMADGQDYLLYSTLITPGLVLSMVFAAETPLRNIRQQARKLIDGLLTAPEVTLPEPPASSTVVSPPPAIETRAPQPQPAPAHDDTAPADWLLNPSRPQTARPPELVELGGLHESQVIPGMEGVYRTPHALYKLTYTFLWLPKLPDSALRGDIVVRLEAWIRELCLVYDWRLEQLVVENEYLEVIIACSPADSPEKVVRTLMDATSQKIMTEFPRVAERHPNGQFWAPGYYVVTPGRKLRGDEVQRYIAYQRREQGLG